MFGGSNRRKNCGAKAITWTATLLTLTAALAEAMDLDPDLGSVLVIAVSEGCPAAQAGLLASEKQVEIDGRPATVSGDVIVAIEGQTVDEFTDKAPKARHDLSTWPSRGLP